MDSCALRQVPSPPSRCLERVRTAISARSRAESTRVGRSRDTTPIRPAKPTVLCAYHSTLSDRHRLLCCPPRVSPADHLAIEHGRLHPRLLDLCRRNAEDVVRNNDQIRQLAGFDRALDLLIEAGVSRPHRISLNRLRDADLLF